MKSTDNPITNNNPENIPDTLVKRKYINFFEGYPEKNDQIIKKIPQPNNR